MTIITKGMGAVLKTIKGLKKSKTFPGPNVEKQLIKKIKAGKIKKQGKGWDISERIGRTQRARDIMATKIRGFREDKGRFTSYTGNPPGANLPEGKMIKIYKPGSKKKDLRKFKEFIKTGTRKK
jgi:hypothetical protein